MSRMLKFMNSEEVEVSDEIYLRVQLESTLQLLKVARDNLHQREIAIAFVDAGQECLRKAVEVIHDAY